jgi:hypothetical protein
MKSDRVLLSHAFVPSLGFISSPDLSFSHNLFTEYGFVKSQIDSQTGQAIDSVFPLSLGIVSSPRPPASQTAKSNSFVFSSKAIFSLDFLFSNSAGTQPPFSEAHINGHSQPERSDKVFPSISLEVFASVDFPFSSIIWTQHRSPISEMIYQTSNLPYSKILCESRFVIAQTSPLVSMKRVETVPVLVSDSNIPSDRNVSPALSPSHPLNLNLQRCSPQWSSSRRIRFSVFAIQSQALEITAAFLSNPLLTTHSDFASILFPTDGFFTLGNDNQLKVSTGSVNVPSVALSGGALIALITIVSLCFVLDRKRHNRPETEEEEQAEGFDLAIEHNEEEEFDDEDENVFDLGDDRDHINSNALSESDSGSGTWVRGRIRGGNHLRMEFDGDESFSSLFCPEHSPR